MIAEITTLAGDNDGLEAVVVGWPRRLDGSPTDQTALVEAFARALKSRIDLPVVLQDERLSSHEAETRLALRESDWRKRKARLDAAAAAIILQDYLDGRAPVVSEDHSPE
jgi:putative holliday junction resolvase